jgi:hypothetical protein
MSSRRLYTIFRPNHTGASSFEKCNYRSSGRNRNSTRGVFLQELSKRVVRLYIKARLNMNNSISEPCTEIRKTSSIILWHCRVYKVGLGGLPVFRVFSVLFSNRFFRFSFYKNRKTVITKLFTVNARNSIIILKTWQ